MYRYTRNEILQKCVSKCVLPCVCLDQIGLIGLIYVWFFKTTKNIKIYEIQCKQLWAVGVKRGFGRVGQNGVLTVASQVKEIATQ